MARNRVISPPLGEHDNLRQPLTEGERLVFEFFHEHLSDEWEIYLQPHLNGLRPDFVLLNPRVGIAVFEVKDWRLDRMKYWVEERSFGEPLLYGEKDGKSFSHQRQNPVPKIDLYKREILELYCPRLDRNYGSAVITAGVIFPFAPDDQVMELLEPSRRYHNMLHQRIAKYYPVSGSDSLESGAIDVVFPENTRRYSQYMNENLARDLRLWLDEPSFASSQRRPLHLDDQQVSLVESRTASGFRRIRGPAGSGKSLVLAARAAEIANSGKSVLVITYNITLLHYLRDLSVRWPNPSGIPREITWLNFHLWCKRVCRSGGSMEDYGNLWRDHPGDDVLAVHLPGLVSSILKDGSEDLIPQYDAVLVDEGQDMRLLWWDVLRSVCRPAGEMLLVADETQDVYGTARSWTEEAMMGAGFSGPWVELKISYRLPPSLLQLAKSFAQDFLPDDLTNLPEYDAEYKQLGVDLYPCHMKWVQTRSEDALEACWREFRAMAIEAKPGSLTIPDITILTPTLERGRALVDKMSSNQIKCVHTFGSDDRSQRRQKMAFYMGDARVKITTLHSFKGWETKALIIQIDENPSPLSLIYSALTRLKRDTDGSYITVVNSSDLLASFGERWPHYYEYS